MKDVYIGVDLGTTGVKCGLFSPEGVVLGSAYREYDLIFTPEGVEQDAELWWRETAAATQEAVERSGVDPGRLAGLSLSTQGISGVLTDEGGRPVANALSWLDGRSREEIGELLAAMPADRLFERTGKNPNAYSLPELMWLKRHRPDATARAKKYLLPLDFMTLRLTGRAVMDDSIACGTMAFDLRRRAFIPELLSAAGVEASFFAEVGAMGQPVGGLLPGPAREMGLPAGLAVALGAQDQRCAALGAGIAPGTLTVSLGTSAAMCMLTDSPRTDPERRVTLVCSGEGRYMTESVVNTACACLKWFRGAVAPECGYDDISAMAEKSPCGANGALFFPEMSESDPERPGGTFAGLRLSTAREDLARAVLEGISFTLLAAMREQERCAGACREVRVFGGGARSRVWRQMLADMTGKPVALPATHETACLGAAILAARGVGAVDKLFAPCGMIRDPADVREPDAAAGDRYRELFARWERMRARFGYQQR